MTLTELLASYSGEDTAQARLDWLQEPVNDWQDLPQSTVLRWCAKYNIIARFKVFASDADTVIQSIAEAGLVLITSSNGLEATNAETRQMMSTMVSKGMVTQTQIDDLIARATVQAPRWQANGVSPEPTIGYIEIAMGIV